MPDINQKKRRWRHHGAVAQRALQHWEEKYGRAPMVGLLGQTKEEEDVELEELFESVVGEIEDRQEYLEAIQKAGGNKELETRTKNEIVERIGELQKIKELQ